MARTKVTHPRSFLPPPVVVTAVPVVPAVISQQLRDFELALNKRENELKAREADFNKKQTLNPAAFVPPSPVRAPLPARARASAMATAPCLVVPNLVRAPPALAPALAPASNQCVAVIDEDVIFLMLTKTLKRPRAGKRAVPKKRLCHGDVSLRSVWGNADDEWCL